MDYLTKWAEAFAVPDQSAETIARLLVEEIFCRHGAPQELLSDRGANFLSNLIHEVCQILKIKKVNTSGYHPQTDGLVEKFNGTLTNMLAKSAEKNSNWDSHLPFLLFAYRATVQESVRESPFYLLYGRDPRLPTEDLQRNTPNYAVDVEDYRSACINNSPVRSLELGKDQHQASPNQTEGDVRQIL
jgi:transposase InsO family protein